MKQIMLSDCIDKIKWIGRTYHEEKQKETFFNWTCSGMEFEFTGRLLLAQFSAYSAIEYDGIPPNAPKRVVWPWITVFLDDQDVSSSCMELSSEKNTCLIFASEKTETHKIKIIKMSENAKGKVGIRSFFMEGEMNTINQEKGSKLFLEFIGDSITCGFGNGTRERDRFFYSGEENGWFSHAAVAARILRADYSIISVSGITVGEGIGKIIWPILPMSMLYPYTDRLWEDQQQGDGSLTEWNFTERIPDIIVINLGTNDSTLIALEEDDDKGQYNFEKNYYDLITKIRKLNGSKSHIICALGPMDYYLYSNIEKVVERYSSDHNDDNISCLKYGKIKLQEGFGACGHPSSVTQLRMGRELADFINQFNKEQKAALAISE